MVHNVLAIDAVTVAGDRWRFGPLDRPDGPAAYQEFIAKLQALYQHEKAEIEARFPKLLRKVAGYNLDHLGAPYRNAAHLLVGSEGTLAYSERLNLKFSRKQPLPVLGVGHFQKCYTVM